MKPFRWSRVIACNAAVSAVVGGVMYFAGSSLVVAALISMASFAAGCALVAVAGRLPRE